MTTLAVQPEFQPTFGDHLKSFADKGKAIKEVAKIFQGSSTLVELSATNVFNNPGVGSVARGISSGAGVVRNVISLSDVFKDFASCDSSDVNRKRMNLVENTGYAISDGISLGLSGIGAAETLGNGQIVPSAVKTGAGLVSAGAGLIALTTTGISSGYQINEAVKTNDRSKIIEHTVNIAEKVNNIAALVLGVLVMTGLLAASSLVIGLIAAFTVIGAVCAIRNLWVKTDPAREVAARQAAAHAAVEASNAAAAAASAHPAPVPAPAIPAVDQSAYNRAFESIGQTFLSKFTDAGAHVIDEVQAAASRFNALDNASVSDHEGEGASERLVPDTSARVVAVTA